MTETWFISDTHFGHRNILTFTHNGQPLRPFKSLEEMDETMVDRWNAVVQPQDRIYHLGDVAINRRCLVILSRLKGRKCLIKGNHDIMKLKDYTPYFDDIRAYRIFPQHGLICSHIPVHHAQVEGRFSWNAHGHLHGNVVMKSPHHPDPRYINMCVEHTNYAPVNFNDLLKRIGA